MGLRACQRGLGACQRGLRACQRDLRVCQRGLRACQEAHGGRTDGQTDGRTDGWTEFLSILHDFVPCWGRCPKREGSEMEVYEREGMGGEKAEGKEREGKKGVGRGGRISQGHGLMLLVSPCM